VNIPSKTDKTTKDVKVVAVGYNNITVPWKNVIKVKISGLLSRKGFRSRTNPAMTRITVSHPALTDTSEAAWIAK